MFKKVLLLLPYIIAYKSYKPYFRHNTMRHLSMRKDKNKDFSDNLIPNVKSYNSQYLPKTPNQSKYVNCLNEEKTNMLVVTGPAGTGKTMFACLKAIDLLKKSEINRIIITRPIVTVEEEIGFLPGNIVKKMDPWTRPIFDLFLEYYSRAEIDNMINKNIIEISPLAFMRGRTFKNAFIIADEMQNSSPNQMKMLTTRIGVNSRIVITGDLQQTDLTTDNGLSEIITKIKTFEHNNLELVNKNMIQLVSLENTDIERSDLVKRIIDIYNYKTINKDTSSKIVSEQTSQIRRINPIDFDAFYRKK